MTVQEDVSSKGKGWFARVRARRLERAEVKRAQTLEAKVAKYAKRIDALDQQFTEAFKKGLKKEFLDVFQRQSKAIKAGKATGEVQLEFEFGERRDKQTLLQSPEEFDKWSESLPGFFQIDVKNVPPSGNVRNHQIAMIIRLKPDLNSLSTLGTPISVGDIFHKKALKVLKNAGFNTEDGKPVVRVTKLDTFDRSFPY